MNPKIRRYTKKLQRWESRGCVGSAVGLPSLGGTKNQFCWIFMDSVVPVLEHDVPSVSWKGRKTLGDSLFYFSLGRRDLLLGRFLFFLRVRNLIFFSAW